MHGRSWTPEEDELLRELYPTMPNAEVCEVMGRTKDSVMNRAHILGIRKVEGYCRPKPRWMWTEERAEWFRSFVPGHSEQEISDEHERLFGFPLRKAQIAGAKAKLGVKSGTHGGRFEKGSVPPNKGKAWDEYMTPENQEHCRATQFRKGQLPHNAYHELLDEKLDKDGVWVYVKPRNARLSTYFWIPKQKFVWMQANGRDWPEGCRAVFADHDNTNYDPENIVPVPKDLYPIVQGAVRNQVPYHDRETLELAIVSARITQARARLAKQMKERKR